MTTGQGPAPAGSRVAVVTDSTASLPDAVLAEHGIVVVPLQVVVDAVEHTEGVDIDGPALAAVLRAGRRVTTSRPAPQDFARTYSDLAATGVEAIVSVHLSGEVSGTVESARLAARDAPVPVTCVDSLQVGIGTGYAALAAVRAVEAGGGAAEAAAAAEACGRASRAYLYVDTLEHLRRGGRVSALGALLGSALAVKPLLLVADGSITPLEKVRTTARALERLHDLVVARWQEHPDSDVAVQHLDSPGRAAEVAARLEQSRPPGAPSRPVAVAEVGAVLGAHVGPQMIAAVVAPRS